MKNFNDFIIESSKTFNQKKEELEEYKKGSNVIFKSEYRNKQGNKITDTRVGQILEYDFSYAVYVYVIEDIVDNGQWLIPKSRVKRLATEKDIDAYKIKDEAKKFNI